MAYDSNGQAVDEKTVRTAGKAAALRLEPDKKLLSSDGNDLSFITVSMVDKDGNLVPQADHQLSFEVSGAGLFKAACNGDATSLEPFTQPTMRLFNGQLVLVVQTKKEKGDILVKVKEVTNRKQGGISSELTLRAE